MRNSLRSIGVRAAMSLAAAGACGGDGGTPPGPPPPIDSTIVLEAYQIGPCSIGHVLRSALMVHATNASGGVAPGVVVSFRTKSGDGRLSAMAATTAVDGNASVSFTCGVQDAIVEASAPHASLPVSFHITVGPIPTTVRFLSWECGTPQYDSLPVITGSAVRVTAQPTDASGHILNSPGPDLQWAIGAGGGSLAQSVTGLRDYCSSGENSWTVGPAVGDQSIVVGVPLVPGAVGVLHVRALSGPQGLIATIVGPDQLAGVAGQSYTLAMQVRTQQGAPFPDAPIRFDCQLPPPLSGTYCGSFLPDSVVRTDAQGDATVTYRTTLAGEKTPRARPISLGGQLPTAVWVIQVAPGPPMQIRMGGGDGQAGQVGAALGIPLRIMALDAFGNYVAGASVAWSATLGGGFATPPVTTTAEDGAASTVWTLGPLVGRQEMTATIVSGASVTFVATASP